MADELRGWKEIGAHFGTSDRTAQRWEHDYGMPVHRTGRTRGASVFALPEELDRWRLSPEGRQASENGNGVASAKAAPVASSGFPFAWKPAAVVGAALIVVAVVAAAVLLRYRRPALPSSPATPVPSVAAEAYAVPRSPMVFVLKLTTADGTPYVFRVLDGGMATFAVRGVLKLGFAPVQWGQSANLTIVELLTTAPGAESIRQIGKSDLARGRPIHFEHKGMSVDLEWTDTTTVARLPPLPPDAPPRHCCIVCDDLIACAAEVTASCGKCCGFGGCVDAKAAGK